MIRAVALPFPLALAAACAHDESTAPGGAGKHHGALNAMIVQPRQAVSAERRLPERLRGAHATAEEDVLIRGVRRTLMTWWAWPLMTVGFSLLFVCMIAIWMGCAILGLGWLGRVVAEMVFHVALGYVLHPYLARTLPRLLRPHPFEDGWRVFYTAQHGDNVTWEIVRRAGHDDDDDGGHGGHR